MMNLSANDEKKNSHSKKYFNGTHFSEEHYAKFDSKELENPRKVESI